MDIISKARENGSVVVLKFAVIFLLDIPGCGLVVRQAVRQSCITPGACDSAPMDLNQVLDAMTKDQLLRVLAEVEEYLTTRETNQRQEKVRVGVEVERAEAFRLPYTEGADVSPDDLWKWLEAVVHFVKNDKQAHSPCLSLVQSSGSGKSRLVAECAKSHYMVYICCADQSAKCYPPPSRFFAEIVLHEQFVAEWIFALALWIEDQNKQNRKVEPEELFAVQAFDSDVLEGFHRQRQGPTDDGGPPLVVAIRAFQAALGLSSTYNVVVVFDEARGLLDKSCTVEIPAFRTARRQFQKACRVEGVNTAMMCLDTAGRISNFSPAMHADPSARLSLSSGFKLFPVLYIIADMCGRIAPSESLADATSFKNLVQIGRRLWASTYATTTKNPNLLLTFANEKLGRGLGLQPKDCNVPAVVVACVVATCGSVCQPHYTLGESVVASHMGVLFAVSRDRDSVMVGGLAEPVLSIAAVSFMSRGLEYFLRTLKKQLDCGLQHKGNVGELASKIILLVLRYRMVEPIDSEKTLSKYPDNLENPDLLAHHQSSIPEFWTPVNVMQWLRALLTKKFDTTKLPEKLRDRLEEYYCAFCVTANYDADPLAASESKPYSKVLKTALQSSAIICPPEGQEAVDLFLPCCKGDDLSKTACILIQIKNQKRGSLEPIENKLLRFQSNMKKYVDNHKRKSTVLLALVLHFGLGADEVIDRSNDEFPMIALNPVGSDLFLPEEKQTLEMIIDNRGGLPELAAAHAFQGFVDKELSTKLCTSAGSATYTLATRLSAAMKEGRSGGG